MPEDNTNVVRRNDGYGAECVLLFIAVLFLTTF